MFLKVLLELGAGFAFIGRQKVLQVGTRDFFLDLLFYHTTLHCYSDIQTVLKKEEDFHENKTDCFNC